MFLMGDLNVLFLFGGSEESASELRRKELLVLNSAFLITEEGPPPSSPIFLALVKEDRLIPILRFRCCVTDAASSGGGDGVGFGFAAGGCRLGGLGCGWLLEVAGAGCCVRG